MNVRWNALTTWILILAILWVSYPCSCLADDEFESLKSDPCEAIRDGFYSFSERIDLSEYSLTVESLSFALSRVLKDDPYLFYVDTRISYSYLPDGRVVAIKPRYEMDASDVGLAWEFCRRRVREMALEAEGNGAEKALLLHDAVCRGFSYDASLESDDLYSMLLCGKGTCQAYTQLYSALLREVGIEAHFVASDSIAHMWNLVRIDREWYHVDCTWDDLGVGGTAFRRRHFLLSDAAALERGHRDWYSAVEVECVSDRFVDVDPARLLHSVFEAGDVNHDGVVTLADLLLLRRGEDGNCPRCADLDCDGVSNERDAMLLRDLILGD